MCSLPLTLSPPLDAYLRTLVIWPSVVYGREYVVAGSDWGEGYDSRFDAINALSCLQTDQAYLSDPAQRNHMGPAFSFPYFLLCLMQASVVRCSELVENDYAMIPVLRAPDLIVEPVNESGPDWIGISQVVIP